MNQRIDPPRRVDGVFHRYGSPISLPGPSPLLKYLPCRLFPPRSLSGPLATMLFTRFTSYGLFSSLLSGTFLRVAAVANTDDPCSTIAGRAFVDPALVIDCHKSFPFNETLRQNILSVVSRVFDFYTFEDFYLNSPPPFQESTTDIRAEIARINKTQYEVSTFPTALERGPAYRFVSVPSPTMILIGTFMTLRRG